MNERLIKAIDNFDLESYVSRMFDPIVPARLGEELRVNCFAPHGCNGSDYKQHLYINPSKKRWICFKCGYGKNDEYKGSGFLPQFIADAEGTTIHKAIDFLLDQVSVTPEEELTQLFLEAFERKPEKSFEEKVIQIPKTFFPLAKTTYPSIPFSTYLRSRGLSDQDFAKYDVRYCITPGESNWNQRAIFPIYDIQGRCRSAVGRTISLKNSRRWVNWTNSDLSSLLWPVGYFDKKNRWRLIKFPPHVVITEGVFDCLAVLKLSKYQAVCTMGKRISNAQIDLLRKLGVRSVTLAWDKDARKSILRLSRVLGSRFSVSFFPFKSQIWDSMDFGDVLVKKSVSILNNFLDELSSPLSYDSPEFVRWLYL